MPMAFRSRPAVRSNRPLGSTGSAGCACMHRSRVHFQVRLVLCCNQIRLLMVMLHWRLRALIVIVAIKFVAPCMTTNQFKKTFISSSYSDQTLLIQRLHQTTHAPPVHKRAGQFFGIITSTGRSTWRTFFEERCGGAGAARGFAAAAARCCAACAWQSRRFNAPASMAVHQGQVYVCAQLSQHGTSALTSQAASQAASPRVIREAVLPQATRCCTCSASRQRARPARCLKLQNPKACTALCSYVPGRRMLHAHGGQHAQHALEAPRS